MASSIFFRLLRFKKSQISVESVIVFGVLLGIVVLLLLVFTPRYEQISTQKEKVVAQEFVNRIASVAQASYINGAYTNTSVYIPSTIAGQNYTLFFGNHIIILVWSRGTVSASTSAPLNTSVSIPAVLSTSQTYTVRYSKGVVNLVS